ncbi:transposase [Morococcus cerebrosus]|uniref:Transposase n=1 Tax=Morococcus cerebrosus TaxID=1056807 RepID=A0A0C1H3T8_9NEIS|nr:transposase [Morococcus cerebrosus]
MLIKTGNPPANYSGLNLNQDKATKPQTVQIVRQGEATLYWFKFNPLYPTSRPIPTLIHYKL